MFKVKKSGKTYNVVSIQYICEPYCFLCVDETNKFHVFNITEVTFVDSPSIRADDYTLLYNKGKIKISG